MKKFHEQMRQARKDSGTTQKQLAKHVGINPRLISRYELGITEPSISRAEHIAQVLGFAPFGEHKQSMEAVVGGYESDTAMLRSEVTRLTEKYLNVQLKVEATQAELAAAREQVKALTSAKLKEIVSHDKTLRQLADTSIAISKYKHLAFGLYVKK